MTDTTQTPQANLTIPAAYLEDFRSGIVAEITDDSAMLATNHESVVNGGGPSAIDDRSPCAAHLHHDLVVLNQVIDATGDTTVTADGDTLAHALEAVVRVLAARLDAEKEYGPINMGAVLDLVNELRWTAEQAVRLDPRLDERAA